MIRPLHFFLCWFAVAFPCAVHAADAAATASAAPVVAKLFAIHFTTGPAWDNAKPANEQKFFTEHSANLARLRSAGVLVIGARYGDKGLIIVRASSVSTALAHLAGDPSIAGGVFKVTVDEFTPFYHGSTTQVLNTPEAIALRAYLNAFNRHEPDAVAALLAPNVKWMTVDIDKLTVEGQGRDAVRDWLAGYFKAQPDVRSEFVSLDQTGILIAVRERVSWTAAGGRRVQESHAIYEIRNGLVTHVWYFPAVRQPTPGQG